MYFSLQMFRWNDGRRSETKAVEVILYLTRAYFLVPFYIAFTIATLLVVAADTKSARSY